MDLRDILIRRGWYAVYGLLVLAATPAMLLLAPVPVLAAAATLTVLAVVFALRPGAPGDPASPGRWTPRRRRRADRRRDRAAAGL